MNPRYKILKLFAISTLILIFIKDIYSQNVGAKARININNINMPLDNKGILADVYLNDGGPLNGFFLNHEFLFSGGFFISGKSIDTSWVNGVASAMLISDYQPGTVGMNPNDSLASLYKVNTQDPAFGQSWQDWKDAVNLGADFYDGDNDGQYNPIDLNNNGQWDPNEDKPDIIGDEVFWCVFNDGVPAGDRRWEIEPQGIEIRQTVFAFASFQELGNVVFIRYRIKNTGLVSDTIKDVYFCNYADADIGEYGGFVNNFTGFDTLRNADYTYMKDPSPQDWGDNPPCFMTDMLTGPLSYLPGISFQDINSNDIYDPGIDIPLDTAYSYRGLLGVYAHPGALNLKLSSSVFYLGGDPELGEPIYANEAINNLMGLTAFGNTVDPCNWPYAEVFGGVDCNEVNPLFWSSGDPVSYVGWISTADGDLKNIQSSGPFKLIKNKEIEILAAYEVGQGDSALGSVTVARNISDVIQNFYENNFNFPFTLSSNDQKIKKSSYSLSQNYPNPFNPSTNIKFSLQKSGIITLKVFDVLGREVKTLINGYKNAGEHQINFNAQNLASGIYYYQLIQDNNIQTKKMMLLK